MRKIYIEMTTYHEAIGEWAFKKRVCAPEKRLNGCISVFWSKINNIKRGDIIIHLENLDPYQAFTGYSIACSDGEITTEHPYHREGSKIDNSKYDNFLFAKLEKYRDLPNHISHKNLFELKKTELKNYLLKNKKRGLDKKLNLFYCFYKKQDVLRCMQGAYLSDVDNELLEIIFGRDNKFIKMQ